MNQVPCTMPPYVVQQAFVPAPQVQPQPKLNAVNIEINNPTAGGSAQQPQYAPVTMPTYNYPQAPVYNYPQAQQPVYYPPMPQVAPQVAPTQDVAVAPQPAPQVAPAPQPQVINQQNNNAPQPVAPQVTEAPKAPEVPAPVVTEAPDATKATEQKPEVVQSEPVTPQVDLNAFIAKLSNPDFETQKAGLEEIANLVKESPEKATELLDTKVFDALTNIINFDSSKLQDATPEQVAAREKIVNGKEVTDAEKQLANTITPKEQAERNKSYALFTIAIMQKLYGDEVAKLSDKPVPLTELPGATTVVDNLKDNPNPMVRASAIEALSYIQRPEYKKDLTTVFTVATNDSDKAVADGAKAALEKLNQAA